MNWLFVSALPVAGASRVHLSSIMRRAAGTRAGTRALSASSRTYTVRATAYEAVAGQTDAMPFVTADNSRIPRKYGSHTRWLALSRDLLRPWGGPFEFGDKVRVQGMSPALDGVYTVHDTMNRRYRHCLDVLVHPREHVSLSQPDVKVRRISPAQPWSSTSLLLAELRAPKKTRAAHRRASAERTLAQHSTRTPRRGRASHLAAAPRPATRHAKPALRTQHALLAHQKHRVAKQQLATLPKRAKQRIVAQVHHLPAA